VDASEDGEGIAALVLLDPLLRLRDGVSAQLARDALRRWLCRHPQPPASTLPSECPSAACDLGCHKLEGGSPWPRSKPSCEAQVHATRNGRHNRRSRCAAAEQGATPVQQGEENAATCPDGDAAQVVRDPVLLRHHAQESGRYGEHSRSAPEPGCGGRLLDGG